MKHYLLSVGMFLCSCVSFAQTPELNLEKYWKFRNTYKEKFMKIGGNLGEGLPARAVIPYGCYDSWDASVDGTSTGTSMYGMMKWGDGMIRHGHYLTLLATEYRLLMNNGQTQQAQATLNELYYALNAVWRLDLNAEENQDEIHNTNIAPYENLNGFYNREDAPENFTDHWKNDPMKMQCTYGAYYTNNNTAKIDDGGALVTKGNSYQNTPSMDQMSGLLVGLAMVIKLVDPVVVQPSPSDTPHDLRQWAEDELYWIIVNPAHNNWFIMDVTNWPVNNGGGDVCLFALPLRKAMDKYVGPSPMPDIAYRKLFPYADAQGYATGYDIEGPYDYSHPLGPLQYDVLFDIQHPVMCGRPYYYQRDSDFLRWQNCGYEFDVVNGTLFLDFWYDILPTDFPAAYSDWADDHNFDELLGEAFGSAVKLEIDIFKNQSVLFNMGVLGGIWNTTAAGNWGEITGNKELELINSVLNPYSPPHDAAYYKAYLDGLSFNGPYNLDGGHWNGTTITNIKEKHHENGWAGEYRWTSLDESVNIGAGEKGIYSALDYMVLYNLYHLKFGTGVPTYKESWSCHCENEVVASGPGGPDDQDAYNNLNSRLQYLDNCQESVFYPVNNIIGNVFNIEPKFSEYPSWGIYTNKYQVENANVLPGGEIKVKTRFVVCNGELNIQSGARCDVVNKEMIVNTNGVVKNSGIILVGTGTQLTLKSGSRLILKSGGKLKVEHGAKLIIEEGATIEYYAGAELILETETAEIILGGTIKAMDATTFSIISQSTTANKGKFTISSPTAAFVAEQPSTYFRLEGYGISDPFITIAPSAKLSINDPDIVLFRVADCSVELKDAASIRSEQNSLWYNVKLSSTVNNGGFTHVGPNQFINCTFSQVPLKSLLNIQNNSILSANNCIFEAPQNNLNLLDNALVKITGRGFNVSNCTFTANRKYCIESSGLTQASTIANSTFTQYNAATGSTMIAVNDVSNVEFKVTSSSFQRSLYAIYKSSGKLSLKCNTFTNNNYCNVKVLNGCTLNMSINDLAGYNVLNKSLQNKNIEVTACPISVKNGYNFIEACTNTIAGTTTITCVPPGCLIDLSNNQWNISNTVPSVANFQIQTVSGNYAVLPQVSTVAVKPSCGYYDGTIVISPPKTKSTFDSDGMAIIWSAIHTDSIRLDDAIVGAMELMTSYDSLGNDLQSLERFNEVFASDVNPKDSLTRNYLWFAFDHMKTTLENAFTDDQITKAQNKCEFEPHVAMYANALRLMTDSVINDENYKTQFYHEIDKAHLFRVIGQPQIGLNILQELEFCGIDSVEQAQLNDWKTLFSEDIIVRQIGIDAIDSTIVIDTTSYIVPELNVNQYSFGAVINSLNDIQYPNCDFFHSKELIQKRNAKQLNLYPNPATESVTVSVISDVDGLGLLSFETADGRKVHSKGVDIINNVEYNVNISNWNPGIYLVTLTYADGKQLTKRLVVK